MIKHFAKSRTPFLMTSSNPCWAANHLPLYTELLRYTMCCAEQQVRADTMCEHLCMAVPQSLDRLLCDGVAQPLRSLHLPHTSPRPFSGSPEW